MAIIENARSHLIRMSHDLWGTVGKLLLVVLVAFTVYVFIKRFHVFAQVMSDSIDSADSESNSFLLRSLIVVLTIVKTCIVLSATFFSYVVIEAHSLVPPTVLCFIYGVVIGGVGGFYYSRVRRNSSSAYNTDHYHDNVMHIYTSQRMCHP